MFFTGLDFQTLGISPQGTVVGTTARWSGSDPDPRRAFAYEKGSVSSLGSLGGVVSEGRAVNARGLAVGGSRNSEGAYRATSFYNGVATDLGTLDGTNSWAMDVNEAGLAVGDGFIGGVAHAAAFFRGQAFDLGTVAGGGETYANGVNDGGDIVGAGSLGNGVWTAFLLRAGEMEMELIGTIGAVPPVYGSSAVKINNNGVVCGSADAPGGHRGFLYKDGEMTDLGDFGSGSSYCADVSDSGMAVGQTYDAWWTPFAFLWRGAGGGLLDLNALVGRDPSTFWLFAASGINAAGQITAYGVEAPTWEVQGYLLTPENCRR
jgi:probable HAF family extracellular repeat protein